MQLTREYLAEKRKLLQEQVQYFTGALEMLDTLEAELLPPDAMTIDQLKQATGAVDIQPVENEVK